MIATALVPVCLHCKRNREVKHKRGLCLSCYCDRAVRALYPRRRHPWSKEDTTADMTDAELDALIAEQLKPENLPSWWESEVRKQQRRHRAEAAGEPGHAVLRVLRDTRGKA